MIIVLKKFCGKPKYVANIHTFTHIYANKSWRQHPTRHQLYGHLPPIMKTIQVRRTRHAGHRWRSRDELIRDVLLWTPTHGRAKAGRPARTYIQQLCEDTGCCPEDLPRAMNDREEWRERVRDIRATSATWWWWWYANKSNWIVRDKEYLSNLFTCLLWLQKYVFLYMLYKTLFFTSALADGLSLEFEWQQVSSSLQDSSQNSAHSQ